MAAVADKKTVTAPFGNTEAMVRVIYDFAADAGDAIFDLSRKFGLSVEFVSQMKFHPRAICRSAIPVLLMRHLCICA